MRISDWSSDVCSSDLHGSTKATNISGGDEGNYANLHANGTGPYMVKERQPDVRTVLVANPDWWGDNKSNVTAGIFPPIGQDATRVAALISGDGDMGSTRTSVR